eukprot:SAG11_NODE_1141_length_5707_cov_14.979315_2_plen_98_part_00
MGSVAVIVAMHIVFKTSKPLLIQAAIMPYRLVCGGLCKVRAPPHGRLRLSRTAAAGHRPAAHAPTQGAKHTHIETASGREGRGGTKGWLVRGCRYTS